MRYFAGARAASGVDTETHEAATLDQLVTRLVGAHGERLERVLTACSFLVDGGPATVGVIASVTRSFCGACDRTRLTADGQIRNCLFAREESDLRTPMREGATDQELADRWRIATMAKLPGHGIDDPSFLQPDRPMSAIGG